MRTIVSKLCVAAISAVLLLLSAPPAFSDRAPVIADNSGLSGHIDRGSQSYVFNGDANEAARISTFPKHDLDVRGPRGYHVRAQSADGLNLTLPAQGQYTVTVSGQAGDFGIALWRINTTPPPSALSIDHPIEGGFSQTDAKGQCAPQTFTYAAQAGEITRFNFRSHGTKAILHVTGNGVDATSEETSTGAQNVSFQNAGAYVVSLSCTQGWGNYTLTATRPLLAKTAPASALAVGQTVHGAQADTDPLYVISIQPYPVEVYTIDAHQGQRVIAQLSVPGSKPAGMLHILGPNGARLPVDVQDPDVNVSATEMRNTYLDVTFPATGQYRLLAYLPYGGDYTLSLMNAATGAQAIAGTTDAAVQRAAARQAQLNALAQRGDQLLNAGDNAGAADAYTQYLSIDFQNANIFNNRGVALMRQGSFFYAGMDFQQALNVDSNNANARANLALAQQAQRQQEQDAANQRAENNANFLNNALGAFSAGYDAGMAQRQAQEQAAQAAAQARAQAQTQAQAAAQARAQQQAQAQSQQQTHTGTPPQQQVASAQDQAHAQEVARVHAENEREAEAGRARAEAQARSQQQAAAELEARRQAHNPANDATHCLSVQEAGSGTNVHVGGAVSGRVLVNSCGFVVEASWCVVGSECGRSGNLYTIGANSYYPIMGGQGQVRFAACRGSDSMGSVRGAPNDGSIHYSCPDALQGH